MTPTALSSARWERRAREGGEPYLRGYWDAGQQAHRRILLDAIRALRPASVLEIGCHVGTNLRLLAESRADGPALAGIDLSPEAINYGKTRFSEEGIPADLTVQSALTFDTPTVDVVFSCYALSYLAPQDIAAVLARMWAHAERGMVLAEPMVGPYRDALIRTEPCPEWRHDYMALALELPGVGTLIREPVAPPVDALNAVLSLRRKDR